MSFFKPRTRASMRCSEEQAVKNLEQAVEKFVKQVRWYPYRTRLNELRLPLLQIKMARRQKHETIT